MQLRRNHLDKVLRIKIESVSSFNYNGPKRRVNAHLEHELTLLCMRSHTSQGVFYSHDLLDGFSDLVVLSSVEVFVLGTK